MEIQNKFSLKLMLMFTYQRQMYVWLTDEIKKKCAQ